MATVRKRCCEALCCTRHASAGFARWHVPVHKTLVVMFTSSRAGIALVVTLAVLSACKASYEEVSSDPRYAKYLGRVCTTTRELQAQGIAVNYERARGTDYVAVAEPLAVRSYTTFVVALNAGTKFNVLGVRQCANCPFDEVVKFHVAFEVEPKEFQGKPVYLTAHSQLEQVASCR